MRMTLDIAKHADGLGGWGGVPLASFRGHTVSEMLPAAARGAASALTLGPLEL
jgi:hypothetical protein